jgi:hypothetical protein
VDETTGVPAILTAYLIVNAGQALVWPTMTTAALASLRAEFYPHGTAPRRWRGELRVVDRWHRALACALLAAAVLEVQRAAGETVGEGCGVTPGGPARRASGRQLP